MTKDKWIDELFSLGLEAERAGEDARARSFFSRILALDPDESGAYYAIGMLDEKKGDYVRAEKNYRTALRMNPENRDATFFLANLMDITGRRDEAKGLYTLLIHKTADPMACLNLGSIYEEEGDDIRALHFFDLALKKLGDLPLAHFNRAVALAKLGRRDEAISAYHHAKRLEPANPKPYLNLSALFIAEKNDEASLEILEEGIGHVEDANLYYNKACALMHLHRPDEAFRSMDRAVRLNPDLIPYLKEDPDFRDWREDPRYLKYMEAKNDHD